MAHRLGVRSNLKTKEGSTFHRSGSDRRASRRSTWPRPTPSAPAASTPSRWRSGKVVLPDGTVDTDAGWRPERRRVIADWVADEVTEILEDNMTQGTGTARVSSTGRPPARPAPRTITRTGSAATRRPSRQCGSGIRRADPDGERARDLVAGGTFPATIWNLFMVDDRQHGARRVRSAHIRARVARVRARPVRERLRLHAVLPTPPPSPSRRRPRAGANPAAFAAFASRRRRHPRRRPSRPATSSPSYLRAAVRAAALVAPLYLVAAALPQGGLFRGREYLDVGSYGSTRRDSSTDGCPTATSSSSTPARSSS